MTGHRGPVRRALRGLEKNPEWQYRIHRVGAYFWLTQMPVVAALLVWAPVIWAKISILLLAEYSLYANFVGDFGAMSSAEAARRAGNGNSGDGGDGGDGEPGDG